MFTLPKRRLQTTSHILKSGYGNRNHEILTYANDPELPFDSEARDEALFEVTKDVRRREEFVQKASKYAFTMGQLSEIIRMAEINLNSLRVLFQDLNFDDRIAKVTDVDFMSKFTLARSILYPPFARQCLFMDGLMTGTDGEGFHVAIAFEDSYKIYFCYSHRERSPVICMSHTEEIYMGENVSFIIPVLT